jgi:hypothetical protein
VCKSVNPETVSSDWPWVLINAVIVEVKSSRKMDRGLDRFRD